MNQTDTVNITILDKEYRIACPPEEREVLHRTAQYLDERMREIRAARRVIGADRIAVLAALNITHELLELKDRELAVDDEISKRLELLARQIGAAIDDCATDMK
ncbi:MAG: cell division protein ZapA [Halothiobacillaceae bacterium]